ncbi:MFS transporter [Paenibacillus sp. P25]|nr:MFS transporter [Paenibacillus sp. P25]
MGNPAVLFFLIMFVIGTDTFLISPLIPTLQDLFHISTGMSGWMMGAYALGYALFALIAGPLSDGWDRKKVMLGGIICFAVSTILCGFATGFWSMFLFRFLAGVSAAFTSPQVWAAIPALFPPQRIAKVLGTTAQASPYRRRSAYRSATGSPLPIGRTRSSRSEHARRCLQRSSTSLYPS